MLTPHLRPPHWIARMNHRVRTGVFLSVLASMATHMAHQPQPAWLWLLLIGQFVLYPQAIYLAARCSRDPMQLEMRALLLDPFVLGAWMAWLGFPLWITFPVAIGTLISISVYRGLQGCLEALAALVLGALLAAATLGWRFAPDTTGITTALSMGSLALYLLMVALSAHARGLQLRSAREKLRQNEQALQSQLHDNQALQQQLAEQAHRDALTGLYNRRYFDATLERELARCQREQQPLSLLSIDIDHFKRINDQHGHPAGDEVLRQVAQMLDSLTRASDVVCRHGGEEFIVLLPNANGDTAQSRAEAYRAQWAGTVVQTDTATVQTTLSIGVAAYPEQAASTRELVSRADAALYQAKQNGRNRVVAAQPAPTQTP